MLCTSFAMSVVKRVGYCKSHVSGILVSAAALSTGLQGCKVFCLQYVNVATIDVPQSSSMVNYLEQGDVDSAYKVACLGVTEADWRTLALAALQVLPCTF
jgi:Na+-transporting NADH:ubiquinone oxidoreductase subunit NqrA